MSCHHLAQWLPQTYCHWKHQRKTELGLQRLLCRLAKDRSCFICKQHDSETVRRRPTANNSMVNLHSSHLAVKLSVMTVIWFCVRHTVGLVLEKHANAATAATFAWHWLDFQCSATVALPGQTATNTDVPGILVPVSSVDTWLFVSSLFFFIFLQQALQDEFCNVMMWWFYVLWCFTPFCLSIVLNYMSVLLLLISVECSLIFLWPKRKKIILCIIMNNKVLLYYFV